MTIFQAKVLKAVWMHENCGTIEVTLEIFGMEYTELDRHNVCRAMDRLKAIGYIDANDALTEKGQKRLGMKSEPATVAPALPTAAECGLAREAAKTDIDREREAAGLPRLLTEAEYAAAATDPRRHGFRPGGARGCCGLCGQPEGEHDGGGTESRGR